MEAMNSFQYGAFIASIVYRVSGSADALYTSSGSSWPMGSYFRNISLRQNISPPTSWFVLALISVFVFLMSFSVGWRVRFDLLLVLLASLVATISSSRDAFGPAPGRKYSPGYIGRKLGGFGAVGSYGGALLFLLPATLDGLRSAFGYL